MSIIDKVIAAVTPPESDEARREARERARAAAIDGGWLGMVLDHHLAIETAFGEVKAASTAAGRTDALKTLGLLMTGHSTAEEAVLYPAMALGDEKAKAEMSFLEQSMTKIQFAALEDLDPMSADFLDKLEHIRGAVAHHVYEEEGSRFLELQQRANAALQAKLTRRYQEEFTRYCGESLPPQRQSASAG